MHNANIKTLEYSKQSIGGFRLEHLNNVQSSKNIQPNNRDQKALKKIKTKKNDDDDWQSAVLKIIWWNVGRERSR